MDELFGQVQQRNPGWLLIVLGLIVAEFLWHRLRRSDGYDVGESATSLAIAVGQFAIRSATAVVLVPAYSLVYAHRLFDVAMDGVLPWAALILLFEFVYYWFHRLSHRVRWMWATHSVHHSSTRFNLTAAYRLGWTNLLSGGWTLFLPLMWLGFPPLAVVAVFAIDLQYQLLLHTRVVGRLGPLEWVLNTPSHHRVHHATNDGCLDRNFGGILIVFDRLFGTFAAEPRGVALRYGLVGAPRRLNPLAVVLREWIAIARDVRAAPSLGAALRQAFGRP